MHVLFLFFVMQEYTMWLQAMKLEYLRLVFPNNKDVHLVLLIKEKISLAE